MLLRQMVYSYLLLHIYVQKNVTFNLQTFREEHEISLRIMLTVENQEHQDLFIATYSHTLEEERYIVQFPLRVVCNASQRMEAWISLNE